MGSVYNNRTDGRGHAGGGTSLQSFRVVIDGSGVLRWGHGQTDSLGRAADSELAHLLQHTLNLCIELSGGVVFANAVAEVSGGRSGASSAYPI